MMMAQETGGLFAWQMTLGDLVTLAGFIVSIVAAYYALSNRLDLFKVTLDTHASTLITHSDRMDRHEVDHTRRMELHEERFIELLSDVKTIIGREEGRRARGAGG